MTNVVLVLHLLVAIALVGLVLVQRSEGGALGIGGGSGSLISGRGAANALVRVTVMLAGLFFITSISLTLLASGGRAGGRSVVDRPAGVGFSIDSILERFTKPKAAAPAPSPPIAPAPEVAIPSAEIAPAPQEDLLRAGPLEPALPAALAPAPAVPATPKPAKPGASAIAAPKPAALGGHETAIPITPAAKPAESAESTLPAVQTPKARSGPDE